MVWHCKHMLFSILHTLLPTLPLHSHCYCLAYLYPRVCGYKHVLMGMYTPNTAYFPVSPTTLQPLLLSIMCIPKGMDVYTHVPGYVHSKNCPLCHFPYHSIAIIGIEHVYNQGYGGTYPCSWVCSFQMLHILPYYILLHSYCFCLACLYPRVWMYIPMSMGMYILNTAHSAIVLTTPWPLLLSSMSIPKAMDADTHVLGYVHSKCCKLYHIF